MWPEVFACLFALGDVGVKGHLAGLVGDLAADEVSAVEVRVEVAPNTRVFGGEPVDDRVGCLTGDPFGVVFGAGEQEWGLDALDGDDGGGRVGGVGIVPLPGVWQWFAVEGEGGPMQPGGPLRPWVPQALTFKGDAAMTPCTSFG